MNGLRAAVAISTVLHGAALAWIALVSPAEVTESAVAADPNEPIAIVDVDPAPMDVTLLDDHSVASPAPRASQGDHTAALSRDAVPGARPGAARAEIGSAAPAPSVASEPREPEAPDPAAKPHPLMTMRGPKPLDMSPEYVTHFLASSRPLPRAEIAGEQLASEIRAAESNLGDPRWIANASPEQITAERERLVARRHEQRTRHLRPDGAGAKVDRETFRMKVAPDGSARISDKPNLERKGLLVASFDVTDAIMRDHGIDPYASAKLKILDETRDERVAMGKRHRTQQLARSPEHVQRHLDRLWQTTHDIAARKQALFELWDDCAETGSDELVAGGRAARTFLIGFIRSKLPAGSPDAYTPEELAQLNRRRTSRATFAPY